MDMENHKTENYKFGTHFHTNHSLCSNLKPKILVDEAVKNGYDLIIVKDHNEVAGAFEALEYARQEYNDRIKIALGIEFRTACGEFGAGFLTKKECQTFMEMRNEKGTFELNDLVAKIREMKDEGSEMLCDLHHPYDYANPKRAWDFYRAIEGGVFRDMPELMDFFDYTEMNAASISQRETEAALDLAADYDKPIVASIDAHFQKQVGAPYYNETTNPDIRQAILDGDFSRSVTPEEVKYRISQYYRLRSWFLKRVRKFFRWIM